MKEIFTRMMDSYMETVVPKDAGETQRHETRLAFLAGAFSVLKVMSAVSQDPTATGTEESDEEVGRRATEFCQWLTEQAIGKRKEH